jgi:hypothetical protein
MSGWQPDDQAPKSVWDLHRRLDGRLQADGDDDDDVDRIELDHYWDADARKELIASRRKKSTDEDSDKPAEPSWLGRLFG